MYRGGLLGKMSLFNRLASYTEAGSSLALRLLSILRKAIQTILGDKNMAITKKSLISSSPAAKSTTKTRSNVASPAGTAKLATAARLAKANIISAKLINQKVLTTKILSTKVMQ